MTWLDGFGSVCLPSPAPPSPAMSGEAWVNTLLKQIEPLPPDMRELAEDAVLRFVVNRRPDQAPLLLAEIERRRSAGSE